MTKPDDAQRKDAKPAPSEREARLAAALRANLKRRKAAARASARADPPD